MRVNGARRCPFCGYDDLKIMRTPRARYSVFKVVCPSCGAEGPYGEDEESAVQKWNVVRRTDG